MRSFITWFFFDDERCDVKVVIYQDGSYRIKEVTLYTNTGTPYFVENVPEKHLSDFEEKLKKEHNSLVLSNYFSPVFVSEF